MELDIILNSDYIAHRSMFLALFLVTLWVAFGLALYLNSKLVVIPSIKPNSKYVGKVFKLFSPVLLSFALSAIFLTIYTSLPASPTDKEATTKNLQSEIKETYGLTFTEPELENLISHDELFGADFWENTVTETKLAVYGKTVTYDLNKEIVNIQLVEMDDKYYLINSEGKPQMSKEIERVNN